MTATASSSPNSSSSSPNSSSSLPASPVSGSSMPGSTALASAMPGSAALASAVPGALGHRRRPVPPLGGFNLTFLALEVRRLLRNRRTVIFTLIMPVAFFFMFGHPNNGQSVQGVPASAYIMISLAVYGSMVASTAGGAMVSIERAQGWSRQLRLTPLRPMAYMVTKVLTAMVLGLASVLVEFTAGALSGVQMSARVWVLSGLAAWAGSLVFAAFGLFMGYLLPSENVMQLLGPILGMLAFFGGLFVPVQFLGSTLQTVATYTPVYGVGEIARSPLVHSGFGMGAVANVVLWTAAFVAGAAVLFRRDTGRV